MNVGSIDDILIKWSNEEEFDANVNSRRKYVLSYMPCTYVDRNKTFEYFTQKVDQYNLIVDACNEYKRLEPMLSDSEKSNRIYKLNSIMSQFLTTEITGNSYTEPALYTDKGNSIIAEMKENLRMISRSFSKSDLSFVHEGEEPSEEAKDSIDSNIKTQDDDSFEEELIRIINEI